MSILPFIKNHLFFFCVTPTDQVEWHVLSNFCRLVCGRDRVNNSNPHEPTANTERVPLPGINQDLHLLRRNHRPNVKSPRRLVLHTAVCLKKQQKMGQKENHKKDG